MFTLDSLVSHVSEVVALIGSLVNDSAISRFHLDSECFTIPRVDGPDSTSESQSVSSWVNVSSSGEGSPDGVTLSTFICTTIVSHALACLSSGSTVVLPFLGWIGFVLIWNTDRRWVPRGIRIVVIEEMHVSITNGFVSSSLIERVGDSDSDISLGDIVTRRKMDVEVAILPSTNRTFTLDSLVGHVSEVVALVGFGVQDSAVS
jgi:hypothetical protein